LRIEKGASLASFFLPPQQTRRVMMHDNMRQLYEAIKRDFPDSQPAFTEFPSGAAMLDVTVGAETYVMEYLPSLRLLGISRMSTATFG